jgi:hypothetical protein
VQLIVKSPVLQADRVRSCSKIRLQRNQSTRIAESIMTELRVPLYSAETSAPTMVVAVTGDLQLKLKLIKTIDHHDAHRALPQQERPDS